MPVALNLSTEALALYDHLLRCDAQGNPAYGLSLNIPLDKLWGDDSLHQRAWRELVDAGLAVESPDLGRYSKYRYNKGSPDTMTDPTISENERLLQANRIAQARLAESYGWGERKAGDASAEWQRARQEEEERRGVKLTKFFSTTEQGA